MGTIFFIVYAVAGYWSAGIMIYANKIRIGSLDKLFMNRLIIGTLLSW